MVAGFVRDAMSWLLCSGMHASCGPTTYFFLVMVCLVCYVN